VKRPLILFEDNAFTGFMPLLFWRSAFELGAGRKIVLDRVAQRLGTPVGGVWTRDWMAPVAAQRCGAPANQPLVGPAVLVNGRWLPDGPIEFPEGACVGETPDRQVAYIVCDEKLSHSLTPRGFASGDGWRDMVRGLPRTRAAGPIIRHPWEVVAIVDELLEKDWQSGDASIESDVKLPLLEGPREKLHVGERVDIHPTAIINTAKGSIYLGDDVHVGAYCVLEGPLSVGPGSLINAHAWLHGGNAIGPVCKIGGEVQGCVILGYSNKQHNGFLGHSYVGSWVNIGAGTSNSDLKNTYGPVRVPINGKEIDTGQMFFGAVIGDHAKIGINAALPTGCVIGFGASILGGGLVPKYVPSFAWCSGESIRSGDPLRAMDVASAMMARRHVDLTDEEVDLFSALPDRVREFEARSVV
jgi:UDP-N-acetylglucosamine diphosphorylase/glucosamine-1-phosphate N-acetyltransferase